MKLQRYKRIYQESKLQEFIVKDISQLKQYLTMSKKDKVRDLLYLYPYIIDEYESDIRNRAEEIEDTNMLSNLDDAEWEAVVDSLFDSSDYASDFKEIIDQILDRLHYIDVGEQLPTWAYLEYQNIVKNQWLIHFTKDADSIRRHGFDDLVDDITQLGLTTWISKTSSNRSKNGFGFAYLLSDYKKYGKGNRGSSWKYGTECVIFKASGIRCYHFGDEEPQVIFMGKYVTDIVAIERNSDDEYVVYNRKNGKELFKNDDLPVVQEWVVNNFRQYSKLL